MSDSKLIDARGPRFSALITTVVLAIALLTENPIVIWFQTAIFAIGAISGRLTNVVDLQVIVIGGGFGATFDLWKSGAEKGLRENIVVPNLRTIPEFVRAQLGNDAGVIGVADFAYGRV